MWWWPKRDLFFLQILHPPITDQMVIFLVSSSHRWLHCMITLHLRFKGLNSTWMRNVLPRATSPKSTQGKGGHYSERKCRPAQKESREIDIWKLSVFLFPFSYSILIITHTNKESKSLWADCQCTCVQTLCAQKRLLDKHSWSRYHFPKLIGIVQYSSQMDIHFLQKGNQARKFQQELCDTRTTWLKVYNMGIKEPNEQSVFHPSIQPSTTDVFRENNTQRWALDYHKNIKVAYHRCSSDYL